MQLCVQRSAGDRERCAGQLDGSGRVQLRILQRVVHERIRRLIFGSISSSAVSILPVQDGIPLTRRGSDDGRPAQIRAALVFRLEQLRFADGRRPATPLFPSWLSTRTLRVVAHRLDLHGYQRIGRPHARTYDRNFFSKTPNSNRVIDWQSSESGSRSPRYLIWFLNEGWPRQFALVAGADPRTETLVAGAAARMFLPMPVDGNHRATRRHQWVVGNPSSSALPYFLGFVFNWINVVLLGCSRSGYQHLVSQDERRLRGCQYHHRLRVRLRNYVIST